MNKKTKKFLISNILIVFFYFSFLNFTSAVTLTLSTPKTNLGLEEEFAIDVLISPDQEENLNAFDITISTSSNLIFSRMEDGSSITGLWIEKPTFRSNLINFSGIIPGGFTGLIDPLVSDPLKNKKPGTLVKLFFYGKKQGTATVNFNKKNVLANDGFGTILNTNSNELRLSIDENTFSDKVYLKDTTPPEHFLVSLSRDPLLFEGKYVLLFETKDKESGIDFYEIKESNTDWKRVESPYITFEQPPKNIIYVKAVDRAGNSTIEELRPEISISKTVLSQKNLIFSLFVVFIIILFIIIRLIKKND